MTNKHVVKMILESAQLLSTAHRMLDGEFHEGFSKSGRRQKQWVHPNDKLYAATHVNHPSAAWARETSDNYVWLFDHFMGLCCEYSSRYFNRTHKTWDILVDTLSELPSNIRIGTLSKMPQAMPDIYHTKDSVQAYRKYYESEKIKSDIDKTRYYEVLGL